MSVALDHRAAGAATGGSVRRATSEFEWMLSAALLHDYLEWMRAAAGFDPLDAQPGLAAELADLPGHYAGARSHLFLAYLGELAAGTVAVRCHPDGTAELKRMYLRPIARGRGLADLLVGAVLQVAAENGCERVWLETQRGSMDRAIAVYRRNGFVEVAEGGRTLEVDGLVVLERQIADPGRCS